MQVAISQLTSLALAFLFAMRNSYQFKERRARDAGDSKLEYQHSVTWHKWQAGIQVLMFAIIGAYLLEAGIVWYLAILWAMLGAGAFWIVFDGVVNLVGLEQPFFYVGGTAFLDRLARKFKKPELALALAKLLLIVGIVGLIYLIKKLSDQDEKEKQSV